MKKLALAAIIISIALCLGGCAKQIEPIAQGEPAGAQSAQKSQEDRKDLVISESGYYFDEYGQGKYAVIVENQNMGWSAERINLKVVSKDADGAIVGTADSYITMIFANGKMAVCGNAFNSQGAETLEFQIVNSSGMWVENETQQAEYDENFFSQNINENVDEWGDTTVSGEIVNNSAGEFLSTSANVVFRDDSGSIVGGGVTYLNSVPAGSTIPFSVDSMTNVPDHETVEVYVDCGYPKQQ